MMQALIRYCALNATDRQLIREAVIVLSAARLGVAVLPFPFVRSALDRRRRVAFSQGANENSSRHRVPIERVSWAVAAVARRVPFHTSCLVDSLAVDAMLRRRGYASQIRFGVRSPRNGLLTAHSWVEHDGNVVFGATEDLGNYSALSAPGANPEAHDA